MKLTQRNGIYYLVRKVPVRYRRVEERAQVWLSLKTDSIAEAEKKAPVVWSEVRSSWEAMLKGDTTEAQSRYEAARDIAQAHGFRYLPAAKVSELSLDEIVSRLDATMTPGGKPKPLVAAAVLGGVEKPRMRVSEALTTYWRVSKDRITGKNDDQIRRWENPRKKAVGNFIAVVGDLYLDEITADETLDFRDWWLKRIDAGEVSKDSANKDFTHLSDVLRTVNKMKRLGLTLTLNDMRLRGAEKNRRPAFSSSWITERILAPGALAGLNGEARALLLGMVNTGYRPSEGACLGAAQIRLDVEVPHISIEPVGRTLKTRNAIRLIPLLGVSLAAFKEYPGGFDRYRNSASVTDTINKYLTENGLRETPAHNLYSLRHSWQDRAVETGMDDRVRREIFGHALTEEGYGAGGSLKLRRDLMVPISF